ncbi:MAG TPA: TetR/AcrR family transcriptional regulator [Paucimonas sp.]|nr:TetR/AcrR family transcriptional regulator [Paucimonas sp.]
MASRTYDNSTRKEAQAQTIQRIIGATVELHAEKGALATSHAEIAERAGVSVATVYKHFPNRSALLPHCIGAVAESAPPLDVEAILFEADAGERLRLLVETVFRRHRYSHPWLRWVERDVAGLPELVDVLQAGQSEVEGLADKVLENIAGPEVPPPTRAFAFALLDYGFWRRLEQTLGDAAEADRIATHALRLFIFDSMRDQTRK